MPLDDGSLSAVRFVKVNVRVDGQLIRIEVRIFLGVEAGACHLQVGGVVELEPVEVELGLESTSVAGSADLLVEGPPGLKVHWQVAEQVPERVAVVGPEREA